MKLPASEKAIIPQEKLQEYLLSPSHPVGRFKAGFFLALGYTSAQWERLEADIRGVLAHDASLKERTEYGKKYEVKGSITGPSARNAEIVTAWIILHNENIPRFITAYPGD